MRPSFFLYFREIRNKRSHRPGRGSTLTIAIISAHMPGLHIWASAGPGPSSSSPKQWESDGCVKIYNSCQREISTDEIQEEKNYREHSNIKSECQCIDRLSDSVQRKMAMALQSGSASCRNRTHPSRLSTTNLNHSTIASYEM